MLLEEERLTGGIGRVCGLVSEGNVHFERDKGFGGHRAFPETSADALVGVEVVDLGDDGGKSDRDIACFGIGLKKNIEVVSTEVRC